MVIEPRPAPGGALTLARQVRDGDLDLAWAQGLRVAELAREPIGQAGAGGPPPA
ncbi:hypothetical protein [Nonomuraea terrae]|uniref:hypothetical protein n=1 Tax=Nonomuraea terrae TaxID=2530383 RepID=UPI001FEAC53B|nr:hypothetical protein [Nonomuraea terrae]